MQNFLSVVPNKVAAGFKSSERDVTKGDVASFSATRELVRKFVT